MTSERLPGDMPSSLFEAFVKTPEVCARDTPRTLRSLCSATKASNLPVESPAGSWRPLIDPYSVAVAHHRLAEVDERPTWRGRTHLWAFGVALPATVVLVAGALWVPIIRSWALTRGFSLHPGTRNRYEIRCTRTQHRPASRQVNDHGRVSGTHRNASTSATSAGEDFEAHISIHRA